ncbi:MAG: ATP-binding cassette domain-containing protein [Eggerthella lenta]
MATIKGICAESGMSVVAITHDLDVAGKFAESVTVLKEGCVLETVSHSELMNNPGTDYARKLVDAQRLERRPGDEMDSSAGAPVFSASSFDVVTPDGKVATRNAAFSINHGRGLSLFGPSGSGKSTIVRAITGERPAERGSVALDLGDGGMHVLAPSFKDRSQTELAAVQMVPQDPATSLNPALAWTPSFLAPSGGASLLVEERGEGAGLGAFGLGAFARRDQTPAPPLAFGWTGPARCHRPGPRP